MTRWLNRHEAAEYARMSPDTFRRRIKAGLMPEGHGQPGHRRLWSTEEIDAAIRGEYGKSSDPISDLLHEAY